MSIFHNRLEGFSRKALLIFAGLGINILAFGDAPPGDMQIVFENRKSADSIMALYPDIKFERVIPLASNREIEARHRDSGIDLWYIVRTSSRKMTRSANMFANCRGVRGVFETQLITMPESHPVSDTGFKQQASHRSLVARSASVMNDPLYRRQWHYSMINMEKAWELEQGKRNVTVAVMDGWIDHSHPDLAPNMWVNEAERNGQPGVDDDGNGYVDDIYGYNTSADLDYYSPHGTHVAGTVAAVNNNGIGVCGVAGGNGVDTGVRIMSVGIQNTGQKIPEWLMARGFVYAADNGAVISQNSWEGSYTHQSPVLNEAISYFMENAGKHPDSPMKGGLVLFAAGNDNSNTPHFPINGQSFNRNRFITVGAVSSDKIRSSYSNYGWWVDVAAPGGEQNGVSIMSTALEGGYMLMNGTSMACPHVSGVAALIVSKFGSAGLTPEFVKNRILSTATPIEGYQAGYTHATETSLGIVNAYAALCDENKEVPGIPEDFCIKTYDKSYALFSWAMPSDSNGNAPSVCKIYTGKEDVPFAVVKTSGAEAGARYEYFDQSGYASDYSEFTIEAVDCDGNRSGRSAASAVADCTNDLAVINPYNIDNFVVYKPSEYDFAEPFDDVALTFFVNSDGPKTVEIENSNDFIRCSLFRNECEVTFDLTDETPTGTFPFTIKAYENSDPDNAVRLHLTCTVKNALSGNKGVVSTTGGSTLAVVETNKRRGEISMDLTKYLTHPWGTNFAIPDNSRTIKDDFFGFEVNYSIVNGILDAKYNFDNAITFCSASIKLDAVDEYMIESSFDVEVKFIDNGTGIEDAVSDKATNNSGIYTTQGVKLDCEVEDLLPGMYIINGKKVLINR
ncbi:S8 family serine peptidase [Palleniella muris]|uniref:S8 family serine peptidase n=1 Tax=Palleniella muris TaxID=3038145 RepID=UPI001441CC64|nr:S8 family serine peptidase [Palleniella muris]